MSGVTFAWGSDNPAHRQVPLNTLAERFKLQNYRLATTIRRFTRELSPCPSTSYRHCRKWPPSHDLLHTSWCSTTNIKAPRVWVTCTTPLESQFTKPLAKEQDRSLTQLGEFSGTNPQRCYSKGYVVGVSRYSTGCGTH